MSASGPATLSLLHDMLEHIPDIDTRIDSEAVSIGMCDDSVEPKMPIIAFVFDDGEDG